MPEAELAHDAEPGHEARLPVAQEAEQVEARLRENELERPAAAVAPLARQGQRMSEGRVTPPAVGVGEG
jgi:hypothetical protein